MAESIPSGTVQELSNKGQVPETYIHQEGIRRAEDLPFLDVTVVDLGLLMTPSNASSEELDKLRDGFGSSGCIQIINHGIAHEFLDNLRAVAKQFFDLTTEEKKKYSRQENSIEGYGNDMVLTQQQILDWSDRLYLTIHPDHSRNFNYWPDNPKQFRNILEEYTMEIRRVMEVTLKAMARSLNLDDNSFIDQYGENTKLEARFNYYPPCPRPDIVLGTKPHADGSTITVLLQDKEVGGLQVLKDDKWFRVPIVPEALLINIGDQVEITSNGLFKSPLHRVVSNSEMERITLAVFHLPDPDRDIGPLDGLVDESRPRLYRSVKDFVGLYFEYYQQGKRAMETAKI